MPPEDVKFVEPPDEAACESSSLASEQENTDERRAKETRVLVGAMGDILPGAARAGSSSSVAIRALSCDLGLWHFELRPTARDGRSRALRVGARSVSLPPHLCG